MHMALKTRRWSLDELHEMPEDGNKYELVRGQLFVTPPSTNGHETLLARLTRFLDPFVEQNGLGLVYRARAVVRVPPRSEVEPDLMVRALHPEPDETWESAPLPILVVEVLSKSTRSRDFIYKRQLYMELGIPEYWIIDAEAKTVFVVKPGTQESRVSSGILTWHPAGAREPLCIELARLVPESHGTA